MCIQKKRKGMKKLHSTQKMLTRYTKKHKDVEITTMCSRVILMKFVMKHRITQEALADLLQILQLHLPSPNNSPSTTYHFRKEFKDFQYPLIYHHF